MRIWKQQSPTLITIYQKQPQNMEYFNCLGSIITMMKDVYVKLNRGLSWQRLHSTRSFFHQKIGLKYKKDTSEMLHWEYNSVWCLNLDTLESGSEIPW
jgi:hypothetical protein